ncbi:hypothetical protein [Novosphingobium sp.]|nr:hypothetical protein [Novosphingobium sp.]
MATPRCHIAAICADMQTVSLVLGCIVAALVCATAPGPAQR